AQNRPLSLESLPKEHLYRILSSLNLGERQNIRESSKSMKESIEQSDIFPPEIQIFFDKNCIGKFYIRLEMCYTDSTFKLEADYTEADSMKEFIDELKRSFRTARTVKLAILTNEHPVEEEVLDKVTAQFDFTQIQLYFNALFQQGAMRFARRSERQIDCFRIENCTLNPAEIINLPRMRLFEMPRCSGFSDEGIIDIARKNHGIIFFPGDLSDVESIRHIMKIFLSSEQMEQIKFSLAPDYFQRFLALLNLRAELDNLWDVGNLHAETTRSRRVYSLDYGKGYIHVVNNTTMFNAYLVTIIKGTIPDDVTPHHRFTLDL
ncbi:hypothetical protein PFISCL1PPCAC_13180, partial [Pristionchus fissidentatus]